MWADVPPPPPSLGKEKNPKTGHLSVVGWECWDEGRCHPSRAAFQTACPLGTRCPGMSLDGGLCLFAGDLLCN